MVERRYRCGCMTAHTRTTARGEAGRYLAEAEYCPAAMRPALVRYLLRKRDWPMPLEDPGLIPYLRRQEALEAEISAHRRAAGLSREVVRGHDPERLAGELPAPARGPKTPLARTERRPV